MRARLLLLALLAACGKSEPKKEPPGVLEAAAEVRFGDTALLDASEARVVLKNTGKGPLRLELSTHPPFSVSPRRLDIAPGRYELATVRFAPTFEGETLRTLLLAHRGEGDRELVLVGTGRCDCDDADARTTDLCGDLGECVHRLEACSESPPPCWRVEASRELGCHLLPEPDGQACVPSEGLCGGGGVCREGACRLAPPRELAPAWSVAVGEGDVLATPEGDAFVLGRSGELLRVSPAGDVEELTRDLRPGAELLLLDRGVILLRSGLAVEGRDLEGTLLWSGDLPDGTTEPWRFASSGAGMAAVGGTRRPEACADTGSVLVPIDPTSGLQPARSISTYSPTGIVVDQDGMLRVSGRSCSGTAHVIFDFDQGVIWQLGASDQRLLAAQGGWVFGPSLQLGASGGAFVALPASGLFDRDARTLEPLVSPDGGWVFDCTGEACETPASALFFQPGGADVGWRFEVGERPSGLLLEGGELLAVSRQGGTTTLLHAQGTGVNETCAVAEEVESVVTLAGGNLLAVTADPPAGRKLAAFPVPRSIALSSRGWVARGGTPGRARRPIDLP